MFKIHRRRRMSEYNKMCLALVSVGLLLGCAGPLQETKQIQCTDRDRQIVYSGPYIEESLGGYLVHVDDLTRAFYPKSICHKVRA